MEVPNRLLRGGTVKELYELKGEGRSIRGIARELGVSRNSVRRVSEVAGSAEGEAEESPGIQAGPVRRVHRRSPV